MCTEAPQQGEPQTMPEFVSSVLDKLVNAVDGVAGKIGSIETKLSSLEGEVRHPNATVEPVINVESDKPLFRTQLGNGAKPKVKKRKLVSSDVEIIDSDGEKAHHGYHTHAQTEP